MTNETTFPDLPDWTFGYEEVSASVYRAWGRDQAGRSVETTRSDENEALKWCRNAALEIQAAEKKRLGL